MTLPACEYRLLDLNTDVPGLATVLDPQQLSQRISKNYGLLVTGLTRRYIRYKPGMNCLVAYSLPGGNPATRLYAKAYGSDFAEKYAKERQRAEQGWDGMGFCLALPDEQILIREFPNDGKLRSLKVLRDRQTIEHFLRRVLRKRPELWDADVIQLTYKPERRYVAKFAQRGGDSAVAKFFGRDAYARTTRNIEYLKEISYSRLPRLIGRSDRRYALVFEWYAGSNFRELSSDGTGISRDDAFGVGQALAELHQQPVSDELPQWNVDAEAKRLTQLVATLGTLVPDRRTELSGLATRITDRVRRAIAAPVLIHGDFHSKQVLLTENGVRFLDPDELSVGPAQLDVGTFMAHLQRDALRGFLPADVAKMLSRGFLDGYVSTMGRVDSIDPFIALALLRFSHHPFRASENDWPSGIDRIVDLVVSMLDGVGASDRRARSA